MASTSFALSNQITAGRFSPIPRPHSRTFRISAGYATAERACGRGTKNASQTVSFYEILGIQMGATCQEIKSAYRKLARTLHPDVASKHGEDDTSSSSDEFMRLHSAYATLSDPDKRAMYDNSLFRRRPVVSSVLTRRGRSWETDQCW